MCVSNEFVNVDQVLLSPRVTIETRFLMDIDPLYRNVEANVSYILSVFHLL